MLSRRPQVRRRDGEAVDETIGRSGEGYDQRRRVRRSALTVRQVCYLTCLFTSFVISNMLTVALPPNTAFNASSALIIRLFF